MKLTFLIPLIFFIGFAASCSDIGSYLSEAGSSQEQTTEAVPDEATIINTLNEDIFNTLSTYQTRLEYPYFVSMKTIEEAVQRIQKRSPDIFWLNGYSMTTYSSSDSRLEIDFNILDNMSIDTVKAMHKELIDKAESIIAGIPEDSDTYEKILYIHDYLVLNCEYCTEGAESPLNGIWGTAYGCLVNGSATCQGYSEAFLLLMNQLGIEAGICSGISDTTTHAWNYVKVDGKYYWLDVTWDDPATDSEVSLLTHDYFLINDDMLSRSRILSKEQLFVPTCDCLDNNYFVRNNSYLTEYSIDLVRQAFETQGTSGDCYELMFADSETYQTAIECLFTNGEIWDVGDLLNAEESVSYFTNDTLYILNISNT